MSVPQGSVLDPLLFLVYVTDPRYVFHKYFVNTFADDTLISISGSNILEIVNILNSQLMFPLNAFV